MLKKIFQFVVIIIAQFVVTDVIAEEPFKIGYVLDLSGKTAVLGLQSQAGALLAKSQLALEGLPVEIVFEDHQSDPARGVTGVNKLISQDHAQGIISDLNHVSLAVAPLVQRAGLVLLYQSPGRALSEQYAQSFMNFIDYEFGCQAVAEHWKAKGLKFIAHHKVLLEFGERCQTGLKRVFGDALLEEPYNPNEDPRTAVLKFRSRNVEAIFQTGYTPDSTALLKQLGETNFRPTYGQTEALYTEKEKALRPSDLPVTLMGTPEVSSSFIEQLKAANLYQGEESLFSASVGYIMTMQLARALYKCKGNSQTCLVSEISRSPAFPDNGFQGYTERVAKYISSAKDLP